MLRVGTTVSGCSHNDGNLRLGDCRSLVWRVSVDLGQGVLRITYRSDTDPNADPNDATVFSMNGVVVGMVHNTGCHPTDCEIMMPWPAGLVLLEVTSHSTSMMFQVHLAIESMIHHRIGADATLSRWICSTRLEPRC